MVYTLYEQVIFVHEHLCLFLGMLKEAEEEIVRKVKVHVAE